MKRSNHTFKYSFQKSIRRFRKLLSHREPTSVEGVSRSLFTNQPHAKSSAAAYEQSDCLSWQIQTQLLGLLCYGGGRCSWGDYALAAVFTKTHVPLKELFPPLPRAARVDHSRRKSLNKKTFISFPWPWSAYLRASARSERSKERSMRWFHAP